MLSHIKKILKIGLVTDKKKVECVIFYNFKLTEWIPIY